MPTSRRVALLVAPEVTEPAEFVQPRKAAEAAGATVVSDEPGEVEAVNNDPEPGDTSTVDVSFSQTSPDEYDAPIACPEGPSGRTSCAAAGTRWPLSRCSSSSLGRLASPGVGCFPPTGRWGPISAAPAATGWTRRWSRAARHEPRPRGPLRQDRRGVRCGTAPRAVQARRPRGRPRAGQMTGPPERSRRATTPQPPPRSAVRPPATPSPGVGTDPPARGVDVGHLRPEREERREA